ncbi:MAG: MauE/DoxX family redox-associated membrane protein [Pirellulales bacterium]
MCRALPLAVGSLLLVTALLKTFYAADTAQLRFAYELPRWLVIIAVQAELLVGLLLVSGISSRLTWVSGLGLFVVFATFSLYRALSGYESCGCFGPLEVNPWWTLTLDAVIVWLLVVQRQAFLERSQPPVGKVKLSASAAGYLLLGGSSLFLMVGSAPTDLRADDSLPSNAKLVVLKPTEWINQKFPLNDEMSPKIDVSDGESVVLLYHHDCSKCRDALPRYEQLAGEMAKRGDTAQVLLLEVPPYGMALDHIGLATRARLSADRQWFVQAPVEIQLWDGMVRLASLNLPSVSEVP